MTACSVTHVTRRRARARRAPDEPEKAHRARPDLWHAWSALIGELVSRNELDDALGQAQDAVARFPLLAAVWLDLAMVCRACGDADGEVEALGRALMINPGWGTAARQARKRTKNRETTTSRA